MNFDYIKEADNYMIRCIKIWKKQRNYIGQNHRDVA